ncbi:MAG: hypothetical protein ACYS5V_11505, partial [Planctomycetota bacterium]
MKYDELKAKLPPTPFAVGKTHGAVVAKEHKDGGTICCRMPEGSFNDAEYYGGHLIGESFTLPGAQLVTHWSRTYDVLLEALKGCVDWLDDCSSGHEHHPSDPTCAKNLDVLKAAQAAIKAA